MARIRSVHPGFFTDEQLVSVSMAARMLTIGLGIEADDKGIFEWKPLTLKMRLFPADNVDVSELLAELVRAEVVRQYELDGRRYGAIRNFRKFQKPKTPNDIHPAPGDILDYVGLTAGRSENNTPEISPFPPKGETLAQNGEKPRQMEDGGDKGKREDPPKPPRKRRGSEGKTYLPDDWTPPPIADLTPKAKACAELWTKASYETVAEGFVLYWRRVHKPMSDWPATWGGWIIREHAKVMRDQKFGNAPPAANDAPAKPMTDDDRAAYLAKLDAKPWAHATPRAEHHPERRGNTGPPRSIGQLAAGIVGTA